MLPVLNWVLKLITGNTSTLTTFLSGTSPLLCESLRLCVKKRNRPTAEFREALAKPRAWEGQRPHCPSRVLQVSLGLIIYRLLIRASDRLLCILTFKSGHKRVTDCLISLFSTPDLGSEIGVLHVCNRQIAKTCICRH